MLSYFNAGSSIQQEMLNIDYKAYLQCYTLRDNSSQQPDSKLKVQWKLIASPKEICSQLGHIPKSKWMVGIMFGAFSNEGGLAFAFPTFTNSATQSIGMFSSVG